jgi:small basic protein
MNNLTMWSLLVGFAAPLVISIAQRPSWTQGARVAIMVVSCVVIGGGTAYFNDQFNGKDVVSSVLIVLVTAISTYKGLWKPSGIAPKIEVVTTPGSQHVALTNTTGPSAVEGKDPEGGAVSVETILLVVVVVIVVLILFGFVWK